MMRLNLLFAGLLCFGHSLFVQTFNVKDYGAVADAKTVNTIAIQKTIDAASSNGGGTVYIPGGTFVTGTIHLKSNINLNLESGAVLKGSPNLQDYVSYTMPVYGLNYYGMLYATNAENVSISGLGTIDGNNPVFMILRKPKRLMRKVANLYARKKIIAM